MSRRFPYLDDERKTAPPPSRPPIFGKKAQYDFGIRRAVELLQKHDIFTVESCEGGEGHSYPEPTIKFTGTPTTGWKALVVCLDYGLPIRDLRQMWRVSENVPTGPCWEITFRERLWP
jgi:hypothetical protein